MLRACRRLGDARGDSARALEPAAEADTKQESGCGSGPAAAAADTKPAAAAAAAAVDVIGKVAAEPERSMRGAAQAKQRAGAPPEKEANQAAAAKELEEVDDDKGDKDPEDNKDDEGNEDAEDNEENEDDVDDVDDVDDESAAPRWPHADAATRATAGGKPTARPGGGAAANIPVQPHKVAAAGGAGGEGPMGEEMQQLGEELKRPRWQWESPKVEVCVRMLACVCAFARACACVRASQSVHMC